MTQVMSQTKYFVWILTNKLKPNQTKHLRNNWGSLNSNRTFSNIKETLRTMVSFFRVKMVLSCFKKNYCLLKTHSEVFKKEMI